MTVATTKISSKGQVVIPQAIRKELRVKSGDTFLVMKDEEFIVLRKIPDKRSAERLRTARLIDEAWKEVEAGHVKRYANVEELLKDLHKW